VDTKHGQGLSVDGFDVLDGCHRQTIFKLGLLAALILRLRSRGADAEAREMAKRISHFFSTTARLHHEDEERHVFPKLLATADPVLVQDVRRLRQDHERLEENWIELGAMLDAVGAGSAWHDLDALEHAAKVFTELSRDHVALEESCIYPEAQARTHATERREMWREMASRRR
jgi:hemerythrin-like domain-containing protein